MSSVSRQSKLANLIYASELARRYPQSNIKFIAVHPGAVSTGLATNVSFAHKIMLWLFFFFNNISLMEEYQGRLSQLWAAAGAPRSELVDGGFYMPVGRLSNDRLAVDKIASSPKLAEELWDYTQDVLAKF